MNIDELDDLGEDWVEETADDDAGQWFYDCLCRGLEMATDLPRRICGQGQAFLAHELRLSR